MRLHEQTSTEGVFGFFALACGLTWLLAAPLSLAWMRQTTPPPYAVVCAGLSAFGPLFAALVIAGRQKRLGEVFGRWRANPGWILLALFAPMGIHVVATALYVMIGGQPGQWLHLPSTPEQMAALVVFPLGEELGWRGFAHPRMAKRYGLVKGSLALGAFWGLWHLMYSVTPVTGRFDALAQLPLYSLLVAWVFERTKRSMAVAIALHAGAHLDHIELAPRTDLRLQAMHFVVVAVLAALAARSLAKTEGLVTATPDPDGAPV
jgi:membrane protease YdiL (CAAX protease family)